MSDCPLAVEDVCDCAEGVGGGDAHTGWQAQRRKGARGAPHRRKPPQRQRPRTGATSWRHSPHAPMRYAPRLLAHASACACHESPPALAAPPSSRIPRSHRSTHMLPAYSDRQPQSLPASGRSSRRPHPPARLTQNTTRHGGVRCGDTQTTGSWTTAHAQAHARTFMHTQVRTGTDS